MNEIDPLAPALNSLRARLRAAGCDLINAPLRLAIVGGSGYGGLARAMEVEADVPFGDLPGLESAGQAAGVEGHELRWRVGRWAGARIHLLAGRRHLYEGIAPAASTLAARLLAVIGTRVVVLTNAAGGLATRLATGDLILIRDQVNLMFRSPLRGPIDRDVGPRFHDMSDAYDPAAAAMMRQAALACGAELKEGIYAGVLGPNFETRAEVEMLRALGADAVGMSTVPETIALRNARVRVVGLSLITNSHAGKPAGAPTTHEEVLAEGERSQERVRRLLGAALPRLAALADRGGEAA